MTQAEKNDNLSNLMKELETATDDLRHNKELHRRNIEDIKRVASRVDTLKSSRGKLEAPARNAFDHDGTSEARWPSEKDVIPVLDAIDALEKRVVDLKQRLKGLGISSSLS